MQRRERRRLLDERGPFAVVESGFGPDRWEPVSESDLTPFDYAFPHPAGFKPRLFATWDEAEDFAQELNLAGDVLDA